MDKLRIRELIICEGTYDKILLGSLLEADIITTDGFGIFHQTKKVEWIRRIAKERGIIVLTDSDSGGQQIRTYLSKIVPKDQVKHIYIPAIEGKEKRKKTASKQHLLGVEGMSSSVILKLFEPFTQGVEVPYKLPITKTDFYEWGLLGSEGSKERRKQLAEAFDLPELSSNALLDVLNITYDYKEISETVERLFNENITI